jgi:hypothetical protein
VSVLVETRVYGPTGEVPPAGIDFSFSWRNYVQGHISLIVNGVNLLGAAERDTIDVLWALIVTLLESYQRSGSGELHFPERRYTLNLKRIQGSKMLLRSDGASGLVSAVGSEAEVIDCLGAGAVEFFSRVVEHDPVDEWTYLRDLRRARAFTQPPVEGR